MERTSILPIPPIRSGHVPRPLRRQVRARGEWRRGPSRDAVPGGGQHDHHRRPAQAGGPGGPLEAQRESTTLLPLPGAVLFRWPEQRRNTSARSRQVVLLSTTPIHARRTRLLARRDAITCQTGRRSRWCGTPCHQFVPLHCDRARGRAGRSTWPSPEFPEAGRPRPPSPGTFGDRQQDGRRHHRREGQPEPATASAPAATGHSGRTRSHR